MSAKNFALALAPAVIIAVAAVAAYHNSFAGAFVFDDAGWIELNANIRHLWPIGPVLFPPDAPVHVGGRPVVSLTLAINYALGGTNVWGYHAVNLAIHVLAAWTLFGVVRRTLLLPRLRDRFGSAATWLALVAALLWVLHPLQTEAVTYVIQRSEALVGLFYLLTLYCLIRGATSSQTTMWYALAVTVCLLGMGTKELMVTAPVVMLLYDRTFLAGSFREAWRQRSRLYLGLAATCGAVAGLLFSNGFYGGTTGFAVRRFTWWSYLLKQPEAISHYLRLAFWPAGLCFDYGWPPAQTPGEMILPAIFIIGLLGLTGWALARRSAWGFLGAWFFLILAPTSSFVPIQDAVVEHRMYLPLAAVVMAAVIGGFLAGRRLVERGIMTLRASQRIGGALSIIALSMLAVVTIHRNADYWSSESLWADTAAKAPYNERAPVNLAIALMRQRRTDEAIDRYRQALAINRDCAQAHNGLGNALVSQGKLDEAAAEFRKALKIDPDSAGVHYDLGVALRQQGQTAEAEACFRRAVEIDPNFAVAHNNLGGILYQQGQLPEAIAQWAEMIRLEPENVPSLNQLAWVLATSPEDSIRNGRRAVELARRAVDLIGDHDTNVLDTLAAACAEAGQFPEAVRIAQRALALAADQNDAGLADTLRGRIRLYHNQRPYRDSQQPLPPRLVQPWRF